VAEVLASPLVGKRVVITRAAEQSSELFANLSAHGAIPISLPLVSFAPPNDFAPLDAALLQWDQFDWVIFTSANAVKALVARSTTLGRDLNKTSKLPRVAAVGPATSAEAKKSGFSVDHVAKTHLGVALAQELGERLRGQNVFLPRSDHANPDLPAALVRLGANVTEVVAYLTLRPSETDRAHATRTVQNDADAILFYSPSTVHNLAELLTPAQLSTLQDRLALTAIGPVTAAALREFGVQRIITAADTTIPAVIAALETHFTRKRTLSNAGATQT
jgi:uroporphyrinogen-III synthase